MEAAVQAIVDGALTSAAGFFGDFAPILITALGLTILIIVGNAFFGFFKQ